MSDQTFFNDGLRFRVVNDRLRYIGCKEDHSALYIGEPDPDCLACGREAPHTVGCHQFYTRGLIWDARDCEWRRSDGTIVVSPYDFSPPKDDRHHNPHCRYCTRGEDHSQLAHRTAWKVRAGKDGYLAEDCYELKPDILAGWDAYDLQTAFDSYAVGVKDTAYTWCCLWSAVLSRSAHDGDKQAYEELARLRGEAVKAWRGKVTHS